MVGKRFHHAGARDRQNPCRGPIGARVGDRFGLDTPIRLQQRRQPHANQGGELSSRDLRRLADRAVFGGQPRQFGLRTHRLDSAPGDRRSALWPARRRTPSRRLRNRRRASSNSPIPANEPASAGSRSTAVRKCASAAAASPRCRSTPASSRYRKALPGELSIAAVYARIASSIRPAPAAARASASRCPATRNFNTSTRRPISRQRGIDRDRGFECGERVGLIVERQVRFTAADQRRGLRGLPGERPIEMFQCCLLSRDRRARVAESDLGRIERRRRLERRRELALGVPQIAGLKKRPPAIVLRRRPACRTAPRERPGR